MRVFTAALAAALLVVLTGCAQPVAPPPAAPIVAAKPVSNPLEGKRLRYLIGADDAACVPGLVVEAPYGEPVTGEGCIKVAYGNLFDELGTGRYGPYLHNSDTAAQYGEGQINPRGPGWEKNLSEQFARARALGFDYIELDNPDAYDVKDVQGAVDLAASYGLKVIAKNPGLLGAGALAYVAHPAIAGIIVEEGAGSPADMDALRRTVGKPSLPVWFVFFGNGAGQARSTAAAIKARGFRNMFVTYSNAGEYGDSRDVN